jgi:hypothetical protein
MKTIQIVALELGQVVALLPIGMADIYHHDRRCWRIMPISDGVVADDFDLPIPVTGIPVK